MDGSNPAGLLPHDGPAGLRYHDGNLHVGPSVVDEPTYSTIGGADQKEDGACPLALLEFYRLGGTP